jgi:hypothetical protein
MQETASPSPEHPPSNEATVESEPVISEDSAADSGSLACPDYWRQLDLFSPEKFGDTPVHFIGVGATGSYIALLAAKQGITNIHLWDFDSVEAHNLPCQIFRRKDVGRLKVEALAEIIEEATGIQAVTHAERVTGKTRLNGYVFLLVDSMDVRKEIWAGAIKMKISIKLMIETRMAIDNARISAIIPTSLEDCKLWEQGWYPDDEAEPSACSNRAIGPTVAVIAGYALWKLVKHFKGEQYEKGLVLCCRPSVVAAG